jgi:hypothetical protein
MLKPVVVLDAERAGAYRSTTCISLTHVGANPNYWLARINVKKTAKVSQRGAQLLSFC